ncbi:unnamed protein product [Nippostrongylus brasiliensis]|uniref:Rho-GAP domain-containing protein n=1 Tax=Nippostrongylus brasiliensis TaxID=27835 RepID=A0A0N4XIU3_NIPBR|nr:unnamed protein product [Nippostrongylus brasiliensis]
MAEVTRTSVKRSATLSPIRTLISLYTTEEGADLEQLMVDGIEGMPLKDRLLAQQVFSIDSQQREHSNGFSGEERENNLDLIFTEEGEKQRISICHLISTLLAHQLLVQLIGSILCPCDRLPKGLEKILPAGDGTCRPSELPDDIRTMLHHCLDASFQVIQETDLEFQK